MTGEGGLRRTGSVDSMRLRMGIRVSSRLRVIAMCVAFSLLYEASLRGFIAFLRVPALVITLFLFYCAYYSILEDLIRRFRLHNYELALIAIALGNLFQIYLTSSMFQGPHLFLGINWGDAILEHLWGVVLQGYLAFYLATRLVRRNWHDEPMRVWGWLLATGFLAFVLVAASRAPKLHHPAGIGVAVALVVSVLLTAVFFVSLRRPRPAPWYNRPSKILDALSFGSVIVFVCLGFIPSAGAGGKLSVANTFVNAPALRIYVFWSFIYIALYVLWRLRSRREAPI